MSCSETDKRQMAEINRSVSQLNLEEKLFAKLKETAKKLAAQQAAGRKRTLDRST